MRIKETAMSPSTASLDRADGWIVCPECEANIRNRRLAPGAALRCRRCGVVARKQGGTSLQPAWALATAGLLLVALANAEPILTFSVAGNAQSAWIVTGVRELFGQGYWPVAILIFFAAVCGPVLHLGAVWYVAAAACLGRRWPHLGRAVKLAEIMEAWNLVPVFAVATVVAVVRLDLLGETEWRRGALWVLALSLCSLLVTQVFDHGLVEKQLEEGV